jgi:hypothetical protein
VFLMAPVFSVLAAAAVLSIPYGAIDLDRAGIDLSFACSIVKSYGFGGFGVVQVVFQAESDSKMRDSDA